MKKWKPTENEIAATNSWGTWSKEASIFPWQYSDIETCYILEGKATVKDENGNELTFEKGDMVQFEEGMNCTWEITQDIRKKYMFG